MCVKSGSYPKSVRFGYDDIKMLLNKWILRFTGTGSTYPNQFRSQTFG
jgi:hypothetical protein